MREQFFISHYIRIVEWNFSVTFIHFFLKIEYTKNSVSKENPYKFIKILQSNKKINDAIQISWAL